jgi:DNA helicase-2/ATP-dependent DNA helicase PcrA
VSLFGVSVIDVRSAEDVLDGLNDAQREAAMRVRGAVAILAGAGTGKTTTITRRIAYQVATGTFAPERILAVTFTDKAATELRSRLTGLDVDRVGAKTFHAAALSQLRWLWPTHAGHPVPAILDHKAPILASLANALPLPHRFLPRRELAGEIEWAKNRMVPADRYLEELTRSAHQPPIPAELMLRVYEGYERRKRAADRIDFEDMLALAVRMYDTFPSATEQIRARFLAFTVDEFQDVNPLQTALLDRWLGGRDELCVVGDDYQTIYAFAGASPNRLLGFAERFPSAVVVRLERNYRSTPEILASANHLAAHLGGFRKALHTTESAGPPVVALAVPDERAEVAAVVEAARNLRDQGVALEEIAVLYRINARSEPFEEAFAAAGISYQVRDGAFLRRPGPRSALQRLKRIAPEGSAVDAIVAVTDELGFDPEGQSDADVEVTRQADLSRLRAVATEFAMSDPDGAVAGFVRELERRFSTEHSGRGVNLLTYHRAKGLEFDAVFLPRLLDGELPFRSGRTKADPEEERRLLYVGVTRARRYLFLTWPTDAKRSASPFLAELGVRTVARPPVAPSHVRPGIGGGATFDRLRTWRMTRAKSEGVPAYVVFHDRTLEAIAERMPRDRSDLAAISGVGPTKLDRYGDEILAVVAAGEISTTGA